MERDVEKEDRLVRNLQDSGCNQETIEQFMNEYTHHNLQAGENILLKQRKQVLDHLHETQHKLEYLDYIIFYIRKNNEAGF